MDVGEIEKIIDMINRFKEIRNVDEDIQKINWALCHSALEIKIRVVDEINFDYLWVKLIINLFFGGEPRAILAEPITIDVCQNTLNLQYCLLVGYKNKKINDVLEKIKNHPDLEKNNIYELIGELPKYK